MEHLNKPSMSNSDLLVSSELVEAARAAFHSGLHSPAQALVELGNKGFALNLPRPVSFIDAPAKSPTFSARWHAQQIGAAAGMSLPFMATGFLIRKGGRFLAKTLGLTGCVGSRGLADCAEMTAAGFAYDFLLHPLDNDQTGNFWLNRLRNGTTGAITFGTLGAATHGLTSIEKALSASSPWRVHTFYSDLFRHMIGGTVAGAVNAQTRSIFAGKGFANPSDTAESAYTFAAWEACCVQNRKRWLELSVSEAFQMLWQQMLNSSSKQCLTRRFASSFWKKVE